VAPRQPDEQVDAARPGPGAGPERAPARLAITAVEANQPSQLVDDQDGGVELERIDAGVDDEESLEVERDQVDPARPGPVGRGRPHAGRGDQRLAPAWG